VTVPTLRARRALPTAGFALALALVAILLLEGFAAMALLAASARIRLAHDARLAVEGDLLVASELAEVRVGADTVIRQLADGGRAEFPARPRGRGWTVRSWVVRRGSLGLVTAEATVWGQNGVVIGARHATLLLGFGGADTIRVSGDRSRY
jgi:hypothetical protein